MTGEIIGPLGNSYMRIEWPWAHKMLEGFDGTKLLPGPEYRVPIRQLAGRPGTEPLTLSVVPHYPAFPPEMVYPRAPDTGEPAAILRTTPGTTPASRVVYFPGDVDRTCWSSGNTDLSQLIQNSIRWLLGEARSPVSVTGEGIVELFAWETEPGYALHVLNYTNPNMTRGFIRRAYAIGPQHVEFEVARVRAISSVRALRAARTLPFKQSGTIVRFECPRVQDYEVIALT